MATDEQTPGPLPEGFEPMSDRHIAKNRRVAVAIGENNVKRMTWKQASKEQIARGWASSMTITMESMVEHNDSNMVAGFINVAALVLTYALDSVRFERARAEAAEQRAEAAEREVARVLADATILRSQAEATRSAAARERDRMRGNVDAWQARAEAATARAEAAEAEVARVRADALLILGRYRGIDGCFDGEDRLMLGDDECEALDALAEAAFFSTDDVAAAIGRVLAEARPAGEVAERVVSEQD